MINIDLRKTAPSNYVGAWFDWNSGCIMVIERDLITGERSVTPWQAPYYFYVPNEEGDYRTIFGDQVEKLEFISREEYQAEKVKHRVKFESDFSALDRVLMDEYYGRPTPKVNFAFLDIEVDYKQSIGFSSPKNPYAPINAVTIYQSWRDKFVTYAVPPPGWDGELPTREEFKAEAFDVDCEMHICTHEVELLEGMLNAIQEADIISGWNSDFFDIPYIVKRIEMLLGDPGLRSIGYPGAPKPQIREVERYGNTEITYKIAGRNHLDYLQLFQKFTFEGRTSYSLGNIALEELDIPKLEYDGTLEQLYNQDFKKFLLYNVRDVEILKRLDDKYKFISLVNQMAHESTVLFESIMGTVKYVETAIANHAHYVLNLVVHDKNISQHEKVEGAIVINPKVGMHEWIGSVDINSLYPNTIRSLNISPEKIIGQLRIEEFPTRPQAITNGDRVWEAVRTESDLPMILRMESGEEIWTTGKEVRELLVDNLWAISAHGTVFDQSSGRGVVADILGFWYTERKRLQAEKKKWGKEADRIKALNDPSLAAELAEALRQEEHYDLLQLTKKISMNSLYGALLNVAFRFGDERMGASVTATGRQITRHMVEEMSEVLSGVRGTLVKRFGESDDPRIKRRARNIVEADEEMMMSVDDLHAFMNYDGWYAEPQQMKPDSKTGHEKWSMATYIITHPSILYGDTDSCYFATGATNREEAISIADEAADLVNSSFPQFMRDNFNCQPGFDTLIAAGREIVGERGIFQAKKKYVIKVINLDGKDCEKLKSMGSEIKKADTPKVIQKFLKDTVDQVLNGVEYDSIAEFVNNTRKNIRVGGDELFLCGVSKQVNRLEHFYSEYAATEKIGNGKTTLPGHVRAAINYNELIDIFDKGSKTLMSGDKILLFYVKPNEYRIKSIGFPADTPRFPKWFLENFKVDAKLTEDKMIDSKLESIFSALGQPVPSPQTVYVKSFIKF